MLKHAQACAIAMRVEKPSLVGYSALAACLRLVVVSAHEILVALLVQLLQRFEYLLLWA